VDAQLIAEGIQAIADSIRGGYSDAVAKIRDRMEQSNALVEGENIALAAAIEKIKASDPNFAAEMDSVMRDLLYGGICNLSRHTKLPVKILEDLAYEPGAEKEFFADGNYCGTPYRTLPARVRPLVKLADGYVVALAVLYAGISEIPEQQENHDRGRAELEISFTLAGHKQPPLHALLTLLDAKPRSKVALQSKLNALKVGRREQLENAGDDLGRSKSPPCLSKKRRQKDEARRREGLGQRMGPRPIE